MQSTEDHKIFKTTQKNLGRIQFLSKEKQEQKKTLMSRLVKLQIAEKN